MTRIAIVLGSTRPGRRAEIVARWVAEVAKRHHDAEFELVDIGAYGLPMLDEPAPAMTGDYRNEHTKRWAAAIDGFDGYVFVTPEYNHSFPAALKNAIDFLYAEWNDKAAGFVGYGAYGGMRAVEQLRLILAEMKVATVRTQVALSKHTDRDLFVDPENWRPSGDRDLTEMLDQLIAWSNALRTLQPVSAAARG
ncbi:NADPH-dependent FMN reductase [Fodinicola acaciae]|uniref:NADPH-dependent FMN reductase n=1 Tax=Fodinicola acaciae TaxID=2681555 RepID=UPI0013D5D662|nr:NAD(P)H-dependent oxidoreductase [Fodinicola acaciae]